METKLEFEHVFPKKVSPSAYYHQIGFSKAGDKVDNLFENELPLLSPTWRESAWELRNFITNFACHLAADLYQEAKEEDRKVVSQI